MTEYGLYLESGPQRRKTMAHVFDLLGCMANGPTTEAALNATPAAIRAYLRFLHRYGEQVDPDAPFTTTVVEHITEGEWLGNGSPYVTYTPDLEPVGDEELVPIARYLGIRDELRSWTETQTDARLDAAPQAGRTARAILAHVLDTSGYLSAALGGASGFSRVRTAFERGEIGIVEGMRTIDELAVARLRATTPEERSAVRQRPKEIRTLRKGLRRMLEHNWEHLAELSRRPGGPAL